MPANEKIQTSLEQDRKSEKFSIMLKWAFVNMLFCFVIFTSFTIAIYQITVSVFLKEEKQNLAYVLDDTAKRLGASNEPLTVENLSDYLTFSLSKDDDPTDQIIDARVSMGNFGSKRRDFFVYNVDKKLILTTSNSDISLNDSKKNKTEIMSLNKETGYLMTRTIKSDKTGQVIGYIQSFSSLRFFYNVRNNLLFLLVVLEFIAMIFANFIGYFMSNYFLKPLSKLHAAMKRLADSPTEEVELVDIPTGDEIEELADVFNDMTTRTREYVNAQQRFVSDVSHELRTPLAVLKGHVSLLNRWGKDDPEVLAESLKASADEIDKMETMVNDMLAISRLQSISEEYKKEVTDTVHSVIDLVGDFQLIHPDFKIQLAYDEEAEKMAKIYHRHYEQAVTIVLDNAVKYTGDGEKAIDVKIQEDEESITTIISDHGVGIKAEDLENIFDRFYRADPARNREVGGTGLGLAILSRIAESYQGKVYVASEYGVGTSFALKLPKAHIIPIPTNQAD